MLDPFNILFTIAIGVLAWATTRRATAKQRTVLEREVNPYAREANLFSFVAMEYHHWIMNRSFAIFVAPEGLYGWKFMATLDASDPTFFHPIENRLQARGAATPTVAKSLSSRPGGFFMPRNEIDNIIFQEKHKRGMSGIPHTGILTVTLTNGKEREFIILGSANGNLIREKILV